MKGYQKRDFKRQLWDSKPLFLFSFLLRLVIIRLDVTGKESHLLDIINVTPQNIWVKKKKSLVKSAHVFVYQCVLFYPQQPEKNSSEYS